MGGYGGWNPRNDRSGSPESCGCLARATRNISPRSFARTKSERAPLRWGVIYVAEGGNCPRILCPACPRGHTFHPAVSMVNNVPRVVHLNDSSCLQLFWQLIAPPPPSPPSLKYIAFLPPLSSFSFLLLLLPIWRIEKETLNELRVSSFLIFHLFKCILLLILSFRFVPSSIFERPGDISRIPPARAYLQNDRSLKTTGYREGIFIPRYSTPASFSPVLKEN